MLLKPKSGFLFWKPVFEFTIHAVRIAFSRCRKDRVLASTILPWAVLCKLREQLVTDRFTWHMELNHRFNRFKSGFHRLQSCQEHIVRLQDDIQRAIHTKYSLTGVLVDLENAFNTMDCCTSDHCDYCARPYCDRWTAGRQSRSMMTKPRGCSWCTDLHQHHSCCLQHPGEQSLQCSHERNA